MLRYVDVRLHYVTLCRCAATLCYVM